MRRRRILLFYVAFAALLLATTYVILLKTGVSHTFVESLLARFLARDRFSLRGANVDLGGGTVTLEGFELTSPGDPGGEAFVAVDSIELVIETNPLGEVGAVRAVRLRGLHLRLDLTGGRVPDLSGFLIDSRIAPTVEGTAPPPIHVRDSRISLQLSPGERPVDFEDVDLELLPVDGDSTRVVLSGRMTAPAGVAVRVRGSGDFAQPAFRCVLEMAGIPLEPDVAGPYSAQVVEFLADVGIGGAARKLSVWVEYPGSRTAGGPRDEVIAGVNLELANVTCKVPQLPYPLVGADARISANTMQNGTVKFEVENRSVDGDVKAQGTLTNCFAGEPLTEVELRARGVLAGPTLEEVLRIEDDAAMVWQAFQPQGGRADADIRLWNDEPGAALEVTMDLDLHGVSASFQGFPTDDGSPPIRFPHPLTDIEGRVQLRHGNVQIPGIKAKLGDGEVNVRGSVITAREGIPPTIAIDIDSLDLAFSESIRQSLGVLLPEAGEIYDEYSPSGHTAVGIALRFGPGIDAPGASVHLRPLGCTATYRGFPCRVDQIRGSIDIEPRGVTLNLRGGRGDGDVVLNGRFVSDEDSRLSTELWLKAHDLDVDSEMKQALRTLSSALGRTCDYLAVEGRADCEVSLWRDQRDRAFSYDVRIDVLDASMQLENLEVPIHRVNGPVFVHGNGENSRVDVSAVHGKIKNHAGEQDADVLAQGTVHTGPSGMTMDLTSVVRHLQLTDELADAMDRNGAFSRATWDVLRPAGFIDAVTRQTRSPGEEDIHHHLRLRLIDVSSSAEILPSPAIHLDGEVIVDDGVATFGDIRGSMQGARVYCSEGMARHDAGATVFTATVSCEDFPVNERLANLMTGPLRETYLERDVRGVLKVNELELYFRFPDDHQSFESRFRGSFVANDISLTLGTRIYDISGLWRIDEGRVDSETGAVSGGVENGALTILNHRANGINGRFHADPERFTLHDIEGRLHSGRLFGAGKDGVDMVYLLAGDGKLACDLRWESVALMQLLRAAGVPGDQYRGNLSGEFHLEELIDTDLVAAKGHGHLQISEGRLGEVPIFTAIYSYLSPRRRPRFDGVEMGLLVGDRRIDIHDFEATSSLLTATGGGSIAMDGYVNLLLDFPDFFARAADWLVLPQVLHFLTSKVVQFEIYGYLRAPKARPRWLWSDKPGRVQLGPIPAARPKRGRTGS